MVMGPHLWVRGHLEVFLEVQQEAWGSSPVGTVIWGNLSSYKRELSLLLSCKGELCIALESLHRNWTSSQLRVDVVVFLEL